MKLKAVSATQFPSSPMRILSAVVLLIGMASGALAQGTVILQNGTGLVFQWTRATDPTLISVPKNGGFIELIAAPTGTALPNPLGSYTASGFNPNYPTLSGFLAANPGWQVGTSIGGPAFPIALGNGLFSSGTVTINNIAEGANAEYVIIGWTGAFTTYDAAFANGTGMVGQSAIATTATGDPLATPVPGFPVSLRYTFAGFPQAIIPEPTSFALAGLGLAALLVFRRR